MYLARPTPFLTITIRKKKNCQYGSLSPVKPERRHRGKIGSIAKHKRSPDEIPDKHCRIISGKIRKKAVCKELPWRIMKRSAGNALILELYSWMPDRLRSF
jgi:hypothetical protein